MTPSTSPALTQAPRRAAVASTREPSQGWRHSASEHDKQPTHNARTEQEKPPCVQTRLPSGGPRGCRARRRHIRGGSPCVRPASHMLAQPASPSPRAAAGLGPMASLRSPGAHPATLRATPASGPGHCEGAHGEGPSSRPALGASWTDASRWLGASGPPASRPRLRPAGLALHVIRAPGAAAPPWSAASAGGDKTPHAA